jgi:hypothetical protein
MLPFQTGIDNHPTRAGRNAATQNAPAGSSMKVFDQHEVTALLVILWIEDIAAVPRDCDFYTNAALDRQNFSDSLRGEHIQTNLAATLRVGCGEKVDTIRADGPLAPSANAVDDLRLLASLGWYSPNAQRSRPPLVVVNEFAIRRRLRHVIVLTALICVRAVPSERIFQIAVR